jgi:large subunit ribosomal protein L35
MPKQKSNSSAKKRFKITGTGKVLHRRPFRSHNLAHKTRKRKRSLRKDFQIAAADVREAVRLLGPRM